MSLASSSICFSKFSALLNSRSLRSSISRRGWWSCVALFLFWSFSSSWLDFVSFPSISFFSSVFDFSFVTLYFLIIAAPLIVWAFWDSPVICCTNGTAVCDASTGCSSMDPKNLRSSISRRGWSKGQSILVHLVSQRQDLFNLASFLTNDILLYIPLYPELPQLLLQFEAELDPCHSPLCGWM